MTPNSISPLLFSCALRGFLDLLHVVEHPLHRVHHAFHVLLHCSTLDLTRGFAIMLLLDMTPMGFVWPNAGATQGLPVSS
jgi:hypothetical protein